jgi:uncharacterized phage protein (TIGR01671 family)
MNREIKFRVWYGDEMVPLGMAIKDEIVSYDFQDYYIQSEYDDMPLMQYTGLKDKNGKEIYEGDIVKAHNFYFDGNFDADNEDIYQVKYSEWCSFCLVNKDESTIETYETSHFEEPCIEIIGNIYESPELLS